jgi:hypothetical protein
MTVSSSYAFVLAALLASCAALQPSTPRSAIALSAQSPEMVEFGAEPGSDSPGEARALSSRRFEIESAALTRAFGRPRTVGAEVVLPPDFRPGEDIAIAYHVPDLGEDPTDLAERFAGFANLPRIVIVVLDPRGIHGHHAFVDSVNEGPHGEALVTDLLPVLEQHLFGGSSPRRRFLGGTGLGGWSAIRLQLEYCHAFDAVYAFDPEPLDLRCFYGSDLTQPRGAEPRAAQRMHNLREGGVGARLLCLESAMGARGDDGAPLPLFSRATGQLDEDVVAAFARHDPASRVRSRGAVLAPRLTGKIHAIARAGDLLGRDVALRSFAAALAEAGVQATIRTPDDFDLDAAILGGWASMVQLAQP